MTYVPNPDDATNPIDSVIAETATIEFQALKTKINAMIGLYSSGVGFTNYATTVVSLQNQINALTVGAISRSGYRASTISADLTITVGDVICQEIAATVAGLSVLFSAASGFPITGVIPTLLLRNSGPWPLFVKDTSGNILAIVVPGKTMPVILKSNSGADATNGKWLLASGVPASDSGLEFWNSLSALQTSATIQNFFSVQAASPQYGIAGYFDGTNVTVCGYKLSEDQINYGAFSTLISAGNFNANGPGAGFTIIGGCSLTATRILLGYSTSAAAIAVTIDIATANLALTINSGGQFTLDGNASNGIAVAAVSANIALSSVSNGTISTFRLQVLSINSGTGAVTKPSAGADVGAFNIAAAAIVIKSPTLAHVLYDGVNILRVVLNGTGAPVPGTPVVLGRTMCAASALGNLSATVSTAVLQETANTGLKLWGEILTDTGSTITQIEIPLAVSGVGASAGASCMSRQAASSNGSILCLKQVAGNTAAASLSFDMVHFTATAAVLSGPFPVTPDMQSGLLEGVISSSSSTPMYFSLWNGLGILPGRSMNPSSISANANSFWMKALAIA